MIIKDPLIELLAIKLYEHDFQGNFPPVNVMSWIYLADEEKETYRNQARGKEEAYK
jgi:hypothetical protein